MKSLDIVRSQECRVVVGLMSGTSCDGVDVAIVRLRRWGPGIEMKVLGTLEVPFPSPFRDELLALAQADTSRIDNLCRLNVELPQLYVQAIFLCAREHNIPVSTIDLIASHGQTVHHLPCARASLQIGDPAVLAEAFQVPVVSGFRAEDMAVGGQGAPLVPLADFLLLRDGQFGRAVQNLGGIGNVM